MNNIVSIKNVNKIYDKFQLKNINFNIPKGAIVGFIGENGAGKTTTLKAILNLIHIDSGSITIFGKEHTQCDDEIKERIGVVLDNSFFPDNLTANDICNIMKLIYKDWDMNKFTQYLERFNLPSNKMIKELSTGMLMKLKISIVMSHNSELLILDEPTSGLDPIARSEILDIFQEFVEDENHSILVSSHITSDLEQVADYIVLISQGEILLSENKDKLMEDYAIVKCTSEQFNQIDKKDVIRHKKNKYNYQVLIKDKKTFKKKYSIDTIDKATLDEIMLLYIKGE